MNNESYNIYRKTCPDMFIDDTVYKIRTQTYLPLIHPRNITITNRNIFKLFLHNLKETKPFTTSRWNDGEWISTLKIQDKGLYKFHSQKWGEGGQTFVDANLYPIIMSKPDYYIGVSSEVLKKPHILDNIIRSLLGLNLFDGGLMARWGILNDFTDLFEVLKKRNVIIVGPPYYSKMKKRIDFISHIETPELNVWEHYETIKEQLDKQLVGVVDPVVLYSCSFVAKKLIDDNYHKHKSITQIDIGAAFEPYCGMDNRPWHTSMKEK